MKPVRVVIVAVLLAACAATAHGWGRLNEVGTSGAIWLLQPSSARWLAMGGAGTAGADGVGGWWWNPAAPAASPVFNLEASWRKHLADTDMGFMAAALPTAWGVPSVGITYLKTGGIAGYDSLGQETNVFSTQDSAMKLGWALSFGRLSAGLAATLLRQDFGTVQSSGLGVDAGLLLEAGPTIGLGASLLHLGRTAEGDPLPAEVRLGGSARLYPNLAAALDLASPRDGEPYLAAGLEWLPAEPLALRLGWRTGPASSYQLGTLAYFSAGAGLHWNGFSLDYAFEPAGVLGDAHHLSLGYRFVPPPAAAAPAPMTQTAEPALTPRLQILPRSYEGRMVFIPKSSEQALKAKSIRFKVKDAEGKIVRTFTFMGEAPPRELVWDGKDSQGRLVDQDKTYTFDFEYQTDQGVKTEALAWPQVLPAPKLFFKEPGQGEGLEPEVFFRFEGARERVRSWRLTVVDRLSGQPVRVLTGKGALPGQAEWDGKDEQGGWAPASRTYSYQLELIGADYTQATIEHSIVAIPAEILSRGNGRVRFKLLQILFDFARYVIRAEMADKIEMAAELNRRGATIEAVEGHADEVGTRSANQIISQRRAEAVRAFLAKRNVTGLDRIAAAGYGNSRPLAAGEGDEGRSQNRRVEIVLNAPETVSAPDPKKLSPASSK